MHIEPSKVDEIYSTSNKDFYRLLFNCAMNGDLRRDRIEFIYTVYSGTSPCSHQLETACFTQHYSAFTETGDTQTMTNQSDGRTETIANQMSNFQVQPVNCPVQNNEISTRL